jgi:hypothetical protein
MTWPTTSLIDDFNRANNGGAIGGTVWSTPIWPGDFSIGIISNQAYNSNSGVNWKDNYITTALSSADEEVYITVATLPSTTENVGIYTRLASLNSSSLKGYEAYVFGNSDFQLFKVVNTTETQLGATVNSAFSAGDKFGLESIGTTHTIYKFHSAAWSSVLSRTDSSVTAAGNIGFQIEGNNARVDDFSGGAVVGGGTTYNLKSDMRGRGSEQLTPNLNKSFSGNLDAYGKETLTPGKTYNGASGNLDAYGKESLIPGKGFGINGNLEAYGKESFTENKSVSFSGNLDGYGKDNFVENKTAQLAGNMEGYGKEQLTPGKTYSFLGNLLGKAGEVFTPAKAYGLAANLDGLGKLSGTITKTLGMRLDAVGRGLLSGMPQLVSGVQYLLKGDFRGRGDTRLTPTQTMQSSANMRGKGEINPTPTLTSQLKAVFLGKGDLDGRPQLISGLQKVLSASMVGMGRLVGTLTQTKQAGSNLDGRGDIAGQPGQTKQAGGNFRGAGDIQAVPARQVSVSGNFQGKARETFIQTKAAGLFANLEGVAKLSGIAQKTVIAKVVMVGRGWLRSTITMEIPVSGPNPLSTPFTRFKVAVSSTKAIVANAYNKIKIESD